MCKKNRATNFTITDTELSVSELFQFIIIPNYYNNRNPDSNAQLAGININQKYQCRYKTNT